MPALLLAYLLSLNLFAYLTMRSDKIRAKERRRRVPEKRLFLLALCGGSMGVLLGMRRFRHKTQHTSFQYGIPLLLAVNAAAVYILVCWF